eukprot:g797.t1
MGVMGTLTRALIRYNSMGMPFLLVAVMITAINPLPFSYSFPLFFPGVMLLALRAQYGTIKSESLLTIEEIGVQLTSYYFDGRIDSKFVDKDKIESIVINEGITLCRVVFYMAFLVKSENKMTLAFENLRPRRGALAKIFRGTQASMFGDLGREKTSRRGASGRSKKRGNGKVEPPEKKGAAPPPLGHGSFRATAATRLAAH